MGRPWEYSCNPLWLEARKGLLTATEVADLILLYDEWQDSIVKSATDKRFKPASKEAAFAKACKDLWIKKKKSMVVSNDETPAMRRGHCLEPQAVREVNAYYEQIGKGITFYHWDDVVVVHGQLGASPDALDVPIPQAALFDCKCGYETIGAKHGLEIKSFEETRHFEVYELQDKWKIDKRIIQQVAAQIYVMGLDDCTVCFYNPNLPDYGMKLFTFTKSDCAIMFKNIEEVLAKYGEYVSKFEQIPKCEIALHATEAQLYEQFSYNGGGE